MTDKLRQISILIPVYNWDIAFFIEELANQIKEAGLQRDVEIIVMDDHSEDVFANERCVSEIEFASYSRCEKNFGRAIIRNTLAEKANGRYLLFLDADTVPDNSDFLKKYISCIEQRQAVVYGGRSYKRAKMSKGETPFCVYLDSRVNLKKRQKKPWRYLLSTNVLVKRSVFMECPFDNRFSGYGYEDIDWAIRLAKKYKLFHIENTCSHLGLVDKKVVLEKMKSSITNLNLLRNLHPEAFRKMPVAFCSKILTFIGSNLLRAADRILTRLYFCTSSNAICHIFFQMDKVILLAIHRKTQSSL